MSIITVPELKAYLNIDDDQDDMLLSFAVDAANEAVARYTGRNFDKTALGQETARVYQPRSGCEVIAHDFWSTTNLAVKTDDGDTGTYTATWATTDYRVEPSNRLTSDGVDSSYYRIIATAGRTFPTWNRHAAVQVTAAWGWETVPAAVKLATLMKAARLAKRRESPDGVLGGFAEFGAVRVSTREDPDIAMLLSTYRRMDALIA